MTDRKTLPPIKVPALAYDAFEEQAKADGKTFSNAVRDALKEYLAKRGVTAEFGIGQWGGKRDPADD